MCTGEDSFTFEKSGPQRGTLIVLWGRKASYHKGGFTSFVGGGRQASYLNKDDLKSFFERRKASLEQKVILNGSFGGRKASLT